MSAILDCEACDYGDHDNHNPNTRGTVPGMLGGYVCCCKGDCKERYEKRLERHHRVWGQHAEPGDVNA